jgi:ActD protein
MSGPQPYGVLAEFADAQALLEAARRAHSQAAGALIEAYSPFPIAGLAEALGVKSDAVPRCMLLGALLGGLGTYALEWYSAVIDYPLNVGGRPLASWPAFAAPAIEMTLLGAAVAGVAAMLLGNGLPRLNHPLFDVPAFAGASSDRFFLLLRSRGAGFDVAAARRLLESLAAVALHEVWT